MLPSPLKFDKGSALTALIDPRNIKVLSIDLAIAELFIMLLLVEVPCELDCAQWLALSMIPENNSSLRFDCKVRISSILASQIAR